MYPPKKALAFLRWFCREDYLEEIEGDLIEVFGKEVEISPRKAKWKFSWSVLKYFRPGFIRSFNNSYQPTPFAMYKSYFKIGWRNLLYNKGYSLLNIAGLAIGMMVAIVNGLWIWHEFSYNKYFDNYGRIAQVVEVGLDHDKGGTYMYNSMTYPLGEDLVEKYNHQFKRIARASQRQGKILTAGEIKVNSTGLYIDEDGPELFSLQMLDGTRNGLTEMHSVMLAKSTADALFGSKEPIYQTIRINNETDVIVSGVFEDFPQNSEFSDVKYFAPWSLYVSENKWIQEHAMTDLRNHFLEIYVEIESDDTFETVSSQIKGALLFVPEDFDDAKRRNAELDLYPMSDWHLYPPGLRSGQMEPVLMLKLVGAVGAFVLALACINFVNLSKARAEKRAKEIGIRKAIGSIRSQLINQFFTESFLVVIFSFFLAMILTVLVLPGFNHIASKNMEIPLDNGWFWAAAFGFVLFTSVLAGSYPAFYLSSFNPIRALKGSFRIGRLASLPRKVLVVFQFSISVILIIGTIVVYGQIQYAKDRPVGYDREGLIMMRKQSTDFNGKYEVLRQELKNTGMVSEVSESMGSVTQIYSGNKGWDWKDRKPEDVGDFATLSVSHLHGKTVGWQFVEGRDFDPGISSDSLGIVINESALHRMNLQYPIGEPVSWTWRGDKDNVLNYKILGVIKDMVMASPYEPARPTIFYVKGHNGNPNWINIKINPQVSASEALPKIESVFKKVIPSVPFEYKFADEEYAAKFGKEERVANMAFIFAGLAIIISCLGLLGLSSFMAETRTKEIGIRKVLGASVAGLWTMLSKEFVWLVFISCIVATPLSYYLMAGWLQNFIYRTDLSIWVFVATGMGAIGITLLTISYQAVKTALMNPVNSLRSE
ncbi:FtsX-like permease family protein [Algoriphagus sp. D3-2-R+10]|uniref:ABC transporter permease n=1 Tax=Algoriphagus aurantiacus TaxID=3103948 RepID=UPI002B3F128E|nr:FtsX-like permease family protein [Algoriphagus sp. D3-2-R+10]MEB2778520.1 FtsX-like permease family protein [Algoriphagus sp. D3-2-R+10]